MPIKFILSFCLFFCCLGSICYNNFSAVFSIINLSLKGSVWNSLWVIDYVRVCIILMLGVCFGYAYFYTKHYFSGEISGYHLNRIICLFVMVMALLVLTGDFLRTLVFWEYLGVVRFFLILFYMNYLSLRASVITLVSSRFGDVSLFLIIATGLFLNINTVFLSVLLFFIIFTKRARFPFVSWLLEAMRAPTPVSSLVHSSTLVAAGVWFRIRYDMFLFMSDCLFYLCILMITIFITGLCCFFFLDLKKIVALSTCKNIAWCIVYLVFGDVSLSLFQLLRHGVSKCLLFMLVGDVMSGSGGSQARNCVYRSQLYGNLGLFGLFSVILGLSGAPFIGVFFTKHFLLSTFKVSLNITVFWFLRFCVFLSYFYSFRLCRVLCNINVSLPLGVFSAFGSGLMVYFWLFVNFLIAGLLDEVRTVSVSTSFSLIIFQGVACLTTYFFYSNVIFSWWRRSLFGCDNLVEAAFSFYCFMCYLVSTFFYRWDRRMLAVCSGHGGVYIGIYKSKLLKILLMSLLFLICCWVLYNI